MTESQAWVEFASRFAEATKNNDGDFEVTFEDQVAVSGLCDCIHWGCIGGMFSVWTADQMDKHLQLFLPDAYHDDAHLGWFWWHIGTEKGRDERVLAACFLAAMTDEAALTEDPLDNEG